MMNESEEQQQIPVKMSPFMNPMNNYAGTIVAMTNPQGELHKLELTLKSMVEDSRGKVRQIGEPLMNELGVNSVLGSVQSLVSRNTIMSNLNDREVSNLVEFIGDTLCMDLMLNRETYDIKTPAARDKIFFSCVSTAFVVLKRGFEEGDKRFWKGSQQDITMRNEGMGQKKGIFSRIGGMLK